MYACMYIYIYIYNIGSKADGGHVAAIKHLFPVIDVQHRGYLTISDLNMFFREVCEKRTALGHHPVSVADIVQNEIFDMVKPEHPDRITMQDLIISGLGGTVLTILADVDGFWKYDNREHLLARADQDEDDLE